MRQALVHVCCPARIYRENEKQKTPHLEWVLCSVLPVVLVNLALLLITIYG